MGKKNRDSFHISHKILYNFTFSSYKFYVFLCFSLRLTCVSVTLDFSFQVHRTHGVLYVPYEGREIPFRDYEVLVLS